MLYATATFASLQALRNEGGWSHNRTQEQAAARSATAQLVAQFNRTGALDDTRFEGRVNDRPYTALVKQDPQEPNLFYLTATVGQAEFTRVLRQEPRPLHLAFARGGPVTDSRLSVQKEIDGEWAEVPAPPSQPGDTPRLPAITTNHSGEMFALRFGTRIFAGVATPFVSRFDVTTSAWNDLPPIPYHFRPAQEGREGWTVESYGREAVLAANDNLLLTVVGPNRLINRQAPENVAQFFVYNLRHELWAPIPQPEAQVYNNQGRLVQSQEETTINHLAAGDDQIVVGLSGLDRASTLYRLQDRQWKRLPPLPGVSGAGSVDSLACGPNGKLSALVRDQQSGVSLVRLVDGAWQSAPLPPETGGASRISIDAQGHEWVQNLNQGRLYRSLGNGWEEKAMPDGQNREIDFGARPDDELFYYQVTAGY